MSYANLGYATPCGGWSINARPTGRVGSSLRKLLALGRWD